MINIEILKALARDEVEKIKLHATEGEIARLNKEKFNPEHTDRCIYGLMTGSCWSSRAMELIVACCEKVITIKGVFTNILDEGTLNGKPKVLDEAWHRSGEYISPVESLIYRERSNKIGERVIDYLKGEAQELIL